MIIKNAIKFGLYGGAIVIAYQLALYSLGGDWFFQWPALLIYLLLIVVMAMSVFRIKSLNGNSISLQNAFLAAFLTGTIMISMNSIYNYAFIKFQPEAITQMYETGKAKQIETWRSEGKVEDWIEHTTKVNDDNYFNTSDETRAVRNFISEFVTIAFISILIALIGKTALKPTLD